MQIELIKKADALINAIKENSQIFDDEVLAVLIVEIQEGLEHRLFETALLEKMKTCHAILFRELLENFSVIMAQYDLTSSNNDFVIEQLQEMSKGAYAVVTNALNAMIRAIEDVKKHYAFFPADNPRQSDATIVQQIRKL